MNPNVLVYLAGVISPNAILLGADMYYIKRILIYQA